MRLLYDIFFLVFAIFYLPYFLLKGKYHKDLLQRFGIFKKDTFANIAPREPIWLHAVSVGEMKTAEVLIIKIRSLFPSKRFVISNVTQTGHKIAMSIAKKEDIAIYFPIDLSFVVRRLVKLINPSLFISIETEIWPNLITELAIKNVPIVLMNGRISQKSFRNYRLIKPVISSILKKTTLFCMRTKTDAERIRNLGAPLDRINVSGNMKFDNVLIKDEKDIATWPPIKNRDAWLSESSKLIIAGSTHRGEDGKILKSYKILKKDCPDITLLIAPRHIERTNEISVLVEKRGFNAVKISEVEKRCSGAIKDITHEPVPQSGTVQGSAPRNPEKKGAMAGKPWGSTVFYDSNTVFILDSIGHLSSLYNLATVVFMGGSLIPHGGHNFIEPAAYAKPIITGSYVHNFKDVCELFVSNDAIEVVYNANELTNSLKKLLSDENKRKEMGEKAKKVVFDNRGSTDRNIFLIKQFL
jgi:3-deoxy-D-manno-octulosonic-acid transferase